VIFGSNTLQLGSRGLAGAPGCGFELVESMVSQLARLCGIVGEVIVQHCCTTVLLKHCISKADIDNDYHIFQARERSTANVRKEKGKEGQVNLDVFVKSGCGINASPENKDVAMVPSNQSIVVFRGRWARGLRRWRSMPSTGLSSANSAGTISRRCQWFCVVHSWRRCLG